MAARLFLRLPDDPLYAPETTIPAGTMHEFCVPPGLAPYVAHAIGYEEHLAPGTEVTERVLPDGALRLIIDTGSAPAVRVVGPQAQAAVLVHSGHLQGLSLTLRPGAARALLGLPAHVLSGSAHAWEDLAAPAMRALAQRMLEPRTPRARMAVVLQLLQENLRTVDVADQERVHAAMRWMHGSRARRPVRDTAAALGVGERRVEQLFREHVGLTPKHWHRLARFHECLRLLRRPRAPAWVDLAAEAGFHDQAHLANEFRAIAGLTPGQFARERVSASSKTAA